MIIKIKKPDDLGAIASTLCLIHCFATPFIFVAQSCSISCCNGAPNWWRFIDYFFLIVSFFSIYRSTETTSNYLIKIFLWLSWFVLFIIILNEKMALFILNENAIYFPALTLILLHLYNKKYCQCNTTKCCIDEG